jgi:hypothetical protein
MNHKKKGDMKDEEYFQTDPEDHRIERGSSSDEGEEVNEDYYARGLTLDSMALLEDTRYLSEALEVIFLLLEGSDPSFPKDSDDGLTNDEWNKRLKMARSFLETHEKRVLDPRVKKQLRETYLKDV